jgi:hypothetical protein
MPIANSMKGIFVLRGRTVSGRTVSGTAFFSRICRRRGEKGVREGCQGEQEKGVSRRRVSRRRVSEGEKGGVRRVV